MQIEQNFFIGIQDVGANNEISNRALLDALTNIATIHGNLANQGIDHMDKTHFTWMILNWKIEIFERPKACETILVKTWARDYSKLLAYRDFEVINQQGKTVAKATSKWAAVNLKTGRIERITEDLMTPYNPEMNHNTFPGFEFEKISEDAFEITNKTTFKICKSMIDCNKHVHNTSYLDIALEVLPEGIEETAFRNLEVTYKKEIKPNETVTVEYAQKFGKNYVIIKDEEEKELHSIIVFY